MRRLTFAMTALALAAALVVLPGSRTAFAHEDRSVGPITMKVGWLDEPAYAGFRNAVQVRITRGSADAGSPVTDGDLRVVVIFGDAEGPERTEPMELLYEPGTPGDYRAFLIPTRPGTYTFLVTGTAGGTEIEETYTSGPRSFNDIRLPSDVEFPAKDPSRGELAEKTARMQTRLESVGSTADGADGSASTAMIVAIIAAVLGAAATGLALRAQKQAKS